MRGLELLEPTKKDLMISKIISGAASLKELTSNPKSFFNCPDLHGGSGLPEGRFRSGESRLLEQEETGSRLNGVLPKSDLTRNGANSGVRSLSRKIKTRYTAF
jgi:hypothetical protein